MSLPRRRDLAYQERASTPLTDVNFRPARNGGRRRRVSALPRFGPMSVGANGKFNRRASGRKLRRENGGAGAPTKITAVTGSAAMQSTRQLNDGTNGFPALG